MKPIHDNPHAVASDADRKESEQSHELYLHAQRSILSEEVHVPTGNDGSSALHVMLGLVVIWASLYLVARAHDYSQQQGEVVVNQIPFDQVGDQPRSTADEIRDIGMSDAATNYFKHPRGDALRLFVLGKYHSRWENPELDISIDRFEELSMRSNELLSISLPYRSFYLGVHDLIDDPKIGFVLGRHDVSFFSQSLEDATPSSGDLRNFTWKATSVQLGAGANLIFPLERSDTSLTISLGDAAESGAAAADNIRVEFWKADRMIDDLQGRFVEDRFQGRLPNTSVGAFYLTIRRDDLSNPLPEALNSAGERRYDIEVTFQGRTPPSGG